MRTRARYYPPPSRNSRAKKSIIQLIQDEAYKLKRSGEQLQKVNQTLDSLEKRYKEAKKSKIRAFRYNLRLRLAVAEGVRNIYLEYTRMKLAEMARLERNRRLRTHNLLLFLSDLIDVEMMSEVEES